ncbi:NAD(P)/FAD-dependent oxidoreductase [Terrarubrum flagellatum]|uniref:flavin monoamine oxidase family protein n=1 Tax=Terrirubrum flagellatum TaxID=2895980 RepID=UPI003145235B
MPDVVVVGAGAAGVAAGRTLIAAGLSVEILEARDRVGGRAHTAAIDGRPIDLGAHWMHMAERNPLVPLAREAGFASRRAPDARPVYDAGQRMIGAQRRPMGEAWPRLDRILDQVLRSGRDRPLSECLPDVGDWSDTFAFDMGLYSGAPVEEVSAIDFHRVDDGSNRFLADGYGALITHLAKDLPVRLKSVATAVRRRGADLEVTTETESIITRRVIVTVPVELLKRGAITFEPGLSDEVAGAIASFIPAAYEHAILRWPESPLHENGADQLTLFRSDRIRGATMLACVGGSDLHYFELGGPHRAFWRDGNADAKSEFVRQFLHSHFGAESTRAEILHLTDWWNDPHALGSWSVCPPGKADAREVMRHHREGGVRFASEATSIAQANTTGGAWREGERAARKIIAELTGKAR